MKMLDVPKSGDTDEIAVNVRMSEREDQHGQHRHLDLERLNLLAEVFRRPADHQPGDEHREDDVDENPVHPGADAAEHHFAQLHVAERHQAAERRERVVPAVDGAAAGVGRHGREERGVGNAEPNLLALHVAAGGLRRDGLIGAGVGQHRVAARFGPVGDRYAGDEEERHRPPDGPAVPARSRHRSERVGEAG